MRRATLLLALCFGYFGLSEQRLAAHTRPAVPLADLLAQYSLHAPLRFISMRNLQRALQGCQSTKCPERLLSLAGITKFQGYYIDDRRRDIVLFGVPDPQLPMLRLEDLVVAMRNAWFKYAEHKNNTIYYTNLGCSIDPDPNVAVELHQVAARATDMNMTAWNSICRRPQRVRVLGMPTDLHFADVIIRADYDMKRIVNGMVPVPGLEALTDKHTRMWQSSVIQGKSFSLSAGMNRFWFYPGTNAYLGDNNLQVLKKSEVQLLTEAEHLEPAGFVASGAVDPIARAFAQAFTRKFNEISSQYVIYKELEGLYRFVSIVKVLKARNASEVSGLSMEVLLDRFKLPSTPVSRSLPGVADAKCFEHKREGERVTVVTKACLPSCGGVSLDIQPDRISFQPVNSAPFVAALAQRRPTNDAVYWDL